MDAADANTDASAAYTLRLAALCCLYEQFAEHFDEDEWRTMIVATAIAAERIGNTDALLQLFRIHLSFYAPCGAVSFRVRDMVPLYIATRERASATSRGHDTPARSNARHDALAGYACALVHESILQRSAVCAYCERRGGDGAVRACPMHTAAPLGGLSVAEHAATCRRLTSYEIAYVTAPFFNIHAITHEAAAARAWHCDGLGALPTPASMPGSPCARPPSPLPDVPSSPGAADARDCRALPAAPRKRARTAHTSGPA